jgi:predicted metal-dependent hydrolase
MPTPSSVSTSSTNSSLPTSQMTELVQKQGSLTLLVEQLCLRSEQRDQMMMQQSSQIQQITAALQHLTAVIATVPFSAT